MRATLALVLLAACGRVDFGAVRTGDGSLDDMNPELDAPPITDPYTAWGAPTKLDVGFTGAIDDPTLTNDELELAYLRDGVMVLQRRASRTATFGAAASPGTAIDPGDVTPRFSADLTQLYFASSRVGSVGAHDIYIASRPTRSDPFNTFRSGLGINTSSEQRWLDVCSIDGVDTTRYMFAGDGTTYLDLYEGDSVDFVFAVEDLYLRNHPSGEDFAPFYANNCLTLYFSSTRDDGAADLYVATRASLTDPWDPPQPITSLNLPGVDDEDPWVSPDGHRIYFNSTREHGTGDIFMAER